MKENFNWVSPATPPEVEYIDGGRRIPFVLVAHIDEDGWKQKLVAYYYPKGTVPYDSDYCYGDCADCCIDDNPYCDAQGDGCGHVKEGWYRDLDEGYEKLHNVIAWCELPSFPTEVE